VIIIKDSTHTRRQYYCYKCGGCNRYLLHPVVLIFGFLASGNSQTSMSFSYRMAPSTLHSIIMSTCEALWNKLSPT